MRTKLESGDSNESTGQRSRDSKKLNLLKDLRPAFWYLILPPCFMLLFAFISFDSAYSTIYGRYGYTGPDEMSMSGFLDLAHYRPVATEEFWSWQFFFGNLHVFLIFSILMAGFFLFFRPKATQLRGTIVSLSLEHRARRWRWVALTGVVGIVVLELIAALLPGTETGWGPHYYTDTYYRDIPTLLRDGFYVTNNFPYFPQVFLSFLPFLAGFGMLFYLHGLKSFRNRGLIIDELDAKNRPVALAAIFVGIIYFNILIWGCSYAPYTYNAEMVAVISMTAFTVFMGIMWILVGMFTTGLVLFIQRVQNPHDRAPGPKRIHKRKIPGLLLLGTLLTFIISAFLFILPFAGRIELLPEDIALPGGILIPLVFVALDVAWIIFWYRREGKDKFVRGIFMAFFGGVIAFLGILVYVLLRNNFDTFEIQWVYNWILPFIFVSCLTVALYLFGQGLQQKWEGISNGA